MFCATLLTGVALFLQLAAFAQTPPALFSIKWDTNRSEVRLTGEISSEWQKLDADHLQQLFPVQVEPVNILKSFGLPPVMGDYVAQADGIRFSPRYPFAPGVAYRATFHPAKISSVFRLPAPIQERTTSVAALYPSASLLPQNLLKFYLHFSAPMSRGHIYQHIHLADAEGHPVELPFLEIDEELWNPAMTRLTLFLDPGRIKRGVRPLEEVGPALIPDKSYTLTIDADWHDARGVPLKEPFHKTFRVALPDRDPPDPATWKITAPRRDTREALALAFDGSLDQALALRMISVQAVPGRTTLREHETRWLFEPDQPWKAGRHEILVQSTIEDLAGNNVGKPFEVDLEETQRPRDSARVISLSFEIQ